MDYTPEQQVAYETMVADRYEVDPEYFAEKYSMPVGERRQPTAVMPQSEDKQDEEEDENQQEKGKKKTRNARPFFD